MTKQKQESPCATCVTERDILLRIDGKVDKLDRNMTTIKRDVVRSGAIAGALAGGVVSVAVAYIKAQFGGV
jgi:hypothetical protein